jgi:Putative addiction module component
MSKAAQDVLADALRLEPDSRAEIAAELLASLDGPADPDAEAAWDAEIERRIGFQSRPELSGSSPGRKSSVASNAMCSVVEVPAHQRARLGGTGRGPSLVRGAPARAGEAACSMPSPTPSNSLSPTLTSDR